MANDPPGRTCQRPQCGPRRGAPARLPNSGHRVRYYGDDQMADHRIEVTVGEIQRMRVHPSRIHIAAEAGGAGANPLHYRRREIGGDTSTPSGMKSRSAPRACAVDKDALTGSKFH